jgi:hypothetical protein
MGPVRTRPLADAGASMFADVGGVATFANAGVAAFADAGAGKRADVGGSDVPNCGADWGAEWAPMPHPRAMPTSQLRLEGQRMRFGNGKWA